MPQPGYARARRGGSVGREECKQGLGAVRVVRAPNHAFAATLQPDPNFGRILAAYGGVFVAGSLAWGMVFDGFRPDRFDLAGASICLVGVAVIMYAPRGAS